MSIPRNSTKIGAFTVIGETQTRKAAEALGRMVVPNDVLALVGELGAGKTSFAQGLARGLGVPDECHVTSPTFALIHEHPGRLTFYHVDLYRIRSDEDLMELGLEEIFEGEGLTAVEWFDRFPGFWPMNTLEIRILFDGSDDVRRLELWAGPGRAQTLAGQWLQRLRSV